jgi:prepilin-type N-terminal cleavage/methylation domain-containing protein
MTARLKTNLRGSASERRGMTLVEVVAGLALMATLMASLLSIKSRLIRDLAQSDRRHAALRDADQLLSTWWKTPATFPRGAVGSTPDGLSWRTQVIPNPQVQSAGAQVVRLEVYSSAEPLAAVEIVLPTTTEAAALLPLSPSPGNPGEGRGEGIQDHTPAVSVTPSPAQEPE